MLSDRAEYANQDAQARARSLASSGDGIGGAAGEVASHLAAEAFLHALSQPEPHLSRRISPKSESSPNPNNGSRSISRNHPHTCPTTRYAAPIRPSFATRANRRASTAWAQLVSALLVNADANDQEPTSLPPHVGDSRCCRLRCGTLDLLTEDHSLVEEQVRAGGPAASRPSTRPSATSSPEPSERDPWSKPTSPPTTSNPATTCSPPTTRELTDTDIAINPHAITRPHRQPRRARSHLPGPYRRRQCTRRTRQYHRPRHLLPLATVVCHPRGNLLLLAPLCPVTHPTFRLLPVN